ncbi:MAG TPA: type II secretion system protein [Cellvibrio sp.]|nr:type II secretion system protein [Cellvibrio sp.]
MRKDIDLNRQQGFTLVELICVIIIIGVLSITLLSRFTLSTAANIQASRDDLIAALFFAQQTAMARSNIQLVVTAGAVSVTESGVPIVVHRQGYPFSFPNGVSATPITFTYDKLGHTTGGTITLTKAGVSASVTVENTGYAH